MPALPFIGMGEMTATLGESRLIIDVCVCIHMFTHEIDYSQALAYLFQLIQVKRIKDYFFPQ